MSATALLADNPSTTSSGSGIGFLGISVVAIIALIFLLRRSGQRRQGYAQQVQSAATIGSEVMTSGGLFGTVVGGDDEQVLLEIAPGVEVRFARAAIARVLAPEDPLETPVDGVDEAGEDPDGPAGDKRS